MAQRQTANLVNGIDLDVLHETIEAVKQDPELGKCKFRATNKWIEGDHNRTTISDYFAAGEDRTHKKPFELDADEPPMLAGDDEAPNPVEHLLNALAGCVTTSMVAHAAVHGIHIEELESEVEGILLMSTVVWNNFSEQEQNWLAKAPHRILLDDSTAQEQFLTKIRALLRTIDSRNWAA